MWLTLTIPDLCTSVCIYTTHPRMAPAHPPLRQAHMLAQCICVALVGAYYVQASTMHKESATKTVTYLQSETVMQSVAMFTME